MEKEKKTEKLCFLGGCEEEWVFSCKNVIFWKIGKHYVCSEGKNNAHFRCNYLFLEKGPFVAIPRDKTL